MPSLAGEEGSEMSDVTILFRDGTRQEFREQGRPGGSYSNHVEYVPGFVIVTDEWGEMTSFPTDLIQSVLTKSCRER